MNLYYKKSCPYSLKVISFLHETDSIQNVQLIDCEEGNTHSINDLLLGGGKLQYPCLQSGEEWVYESDDIIQRLIQELKIYEKSPITDYVTCVFNRMLSIKKSLKEMENSMELVEV